MDSNTIPDTVDRSDPDPFSIGLAVFAAMAGGGAFLEARRQRQFMEERQRGDFRSAWFGSRRTLIFFKRSVDEFETYIMEDGYGSRQFRIGVVRLTVDPVRHQALRRLRGQTLRTAEFMGDHLDDLSAYLGPEYEPQIQAIHDRLNEIVFPERYMDVIRLARDSIELYTALLDAVGEREGFT